MKRRLFEDDDGDSDKEAQGGKGGRAPKRFKINKEFAEKYEKKKRREELAQRLPPPRLSKILLLICAADDCWR